MLLYLYTFGYIIAIFRYIWGHDGNIMVQSHPELPWRAQGIPKELTGIPREPKGGQSDAHESPLGAQGDPKMNRR